MDNNISVEESLDKLKAPVNKIEFDKTLMKKERSEKTKEIISKTKDVSICQMTEAKNLTS